MRQVYAYARFWKSHKTMLLYPGDEEQTEVHDYQDELEEGIVTCHKTFVTVLNEENKLDHEVGRKVIEVFG